MTRYIIWGLEKAGLAWSVHWPKPEKLETVATVSEDEAGAMLLFGANIRDPSLSAERSETPSLSTRD
jgi:hypothetical protein